MVILLEDSVEGLLRMDASAHYLQSERSPGLVVRSLERCSASLRSSLQLKSYMMYVKCVFNAESLP